MHFASSEECGVVKAERDVMAGWAGGVVTDALPRVVVLWYSRNTFAGAVWTEAIVLTEQVCPSLRFCGSVRIASRVIWRLTVIVSDACQ